MAEMKRSSCAMSTVSDPSEIAFSFSQLRVLTKRPARSRPEPSTAAAIGSKLVPVALALTSAQVTLS